MTHTDYGSTILLTGVLVLLTALSIVSAIGVGIGTPYEILPRYTVTAAPTD